MRNIIETKTNKGPIIIEAGADIVPCAGKTDLFRLGLTPFEDHGRPAMFGSTIKSSAAIARAAKALRAEDAKALNDEVAAQLERLLDGGKIDSAVVLTSAIKAKPDIHLVTVGNPWNDSSLRLYYHPSVFEKATVLWVDGKATKKDSSRIEAVFIKDGGYSFPTNWDRRNKS